MNDDKNLTSDTSGPLRTVMDENILLGKEAFSSFGDVLAVAGRELGRKDLSNADTLLVRSVTRVNADLLVDTPVKFVASATIGVDHVDTEYLRKRSIGFAYAPGSNADSVAEYVVAALLTLSRTFGFNPAHKTLGIIGVGNIGGRVFKHAQTLGMKVIKCDPPKKRLTNCESYHPLDELLEEADIITLHVPLISKGVDRTLGLVDRVFIQRMKRGAILINTSRGSVVDESALLSCRDCIGALVLDVWNSEPDINMDLLRCADIATPHIAGYSFDGKLRGTEAIYGAACSYFGRSRDWTPPEALCSAIVDTIDPVSGNTDPVTTAVLHAYPIERDDMNLRQLCSCPPERRPAAFDELRKTYPKRGEFPHFAVNTEKLCSATIEKLRALRFKTV